MKAKIYIRDLFRASHIIAIAALSMQLIVAAINTLWREFQGIPGLDMSMRLERYYRVNMMPYFISERTPSEKREDLWELLEEVGLDYYDRFEWLLRTNMRCGTDNLIVERADAAQN